MMLRRLSISIGSAMLLTLALATTAFGAHCVNESKKPGAGVQGVVLINPATGAASLPDANRGGRLAGGFADVYLDLDFSGTLSAGDLQIEDDIFLIANHSHKVNPAQGAPAILPSVQGDNDPGGDDHGVSFGG